MKPTKNDSLNTNISNKSTILVIDDNPTNLSLAANALEDKGFNVLIASDSLSGIKRAKFACPDLILLDILMPEIDGFETCRRLKTDEKTKNIPVIFMTALSDSEYKVKGFEVGAVDYVTKPIQISELLARVNLHIQLYFLSQKLEQQVEERTKKLNRALQELQKSQLQLVQSEKMSSLGLLLAGITHEIKNPLGFIAGNLEHTEVAVEGLIEYLKLYQETFPVSGKIIQEKAEEIELEYLLNDLPKMLSSMKQGIEKIQEISRSMQRLSRRDKKKKVTFNLHDGIDSTLMILKYRLRANEYRSGINVIKNYGNIPKILGFPGQLNQVFMNLIANAIDVFDEVTDEEKKSENFTIKISTEISLDSQEVMIKIQDNGPGISEEIKSQIFDNLFTTKEAGKGTGLGLSISQQIVEEKHQGKIFCESKLDQGTIFTIILPIFQDNNSQLND
ncbi:MAG: hybrid sensor histidine kinase/response regulator [Okeania sp. SIO3I5]|uniref:hybrid sensor histidine kinase/response regulator n=1 Tax=Okeania sp. SIO3I5 TaxID=2607805 RepID=UPI0013B5F6C0|nr:hybrid sensor histidine kinase/response regulator [Okeania sp. SIO3I5]NEQ41384.1 hybrid sensor histidine kinase/response regulator [Okeania sp. SIO3I5]